MLSSEQSRDIQKEFEKFVLRGEKAIARLSADENNPFLAAVLGWGREEMADFRLNQAFERGAVTSFGSTLQKVARIVAGSNSGSGVSGADLEVSIDQRRYFVQIKTGPKTVNKNIAVDISNNLNSARARYGAGATGVLGICFGSVEDILPMHRHEFDTRGVEIWAGKDFWQKLGGGDDGTYDSVLKLAQAASAITTSLSKTFQAKRREILDNLQDET